jgi:predicted nucleic acid-binding protein
MAVVVDTNIVSYIFKKDTRATLFDPHLVQVPRFLSFMSLAELRRWELQSDWSDSKKEQFKQLLSEFGVIYADEEHCDIWVNVTNECSRNGRPISTADAWIAAAALMFDIPLVTNNRKDFEHISGITILSGPPS